MKKKIYYIIFIFTFLIIFINLFSICTFAFGEPQIVNKINSAFESIES